MYPDERTGKRRARSRSRGILCGHVAQEAPLGKRCADVCPSYLLPSLFYQARFYQPVFYRTVCIKLSLSVTRRRTALALAPGKPHRARSVARRGRPQEPGTAGYMADRRRRGERVASTNLHHAALAECKCPPPHARCRIGNGESGKRARPDAPVVRSIATPQLPRISSWMALICRGNGPAAASLAGNCSRPLVAAARSA